MAWKNIEKWWEEKHHNSLWKPRMKKIWFTEYGFPSVDGCTNQPNIFVDDNNSKLPFYSKGNIDFRAQALAIGATIDKWQSSPMVENMFLWAWDARPFPYFPSLEEIWVDGNAWQTGHWVQGKLSLLTLGEVITAILYKAGYTDEEFDCDKLHQSINGLILNESYTAQSALNLLRQTYFFDVVSHGTKLLFSYKKSEVKLEVDVDDLVISDQIKTITYIENLQRLPSRIEVIYLDRKYEISSTYSERMQVSHHQVKTIYLPMILDDQHAQKICEVTLYNLWNSRISYSFKLPLSFADIKPADVVKINGDKIVQITEVDYGEVMHLNAITYSHEIYKIKITQLTKHNAITKAFSGPTICDVLDLPTNSSGVSICKNGLEDTWKGATLYIANNPDDDLEPALNMYGNSTNGTILNKLLPGPAVIIDEGNDITLLLRSGTLESISEAKLLNGGNLALVGDEIIQFRDAEFLGNYKYKLSGLLRGRYSTEHIIKHHHRGERFILLDSSLSSLPITEGMLGRRMFYKAISYGELEGEVKSFTYNNNSLKPFSVVHVKAQQNGHGDINITWCRRSRLDSNLRDYVEVPLAEKFEKYDVEIYTEEQLVRTINVSNETTCLYTVAQQVSDFGMQQSQLNLQIYQLSALVGRGYSEKVRLHV